VHGRDEKREHAEMAPVVEQRQEARIKPRQRADRKNDGEHDEGAGAEGVDAQIDPAGPILRRVAPSGNPHEARDIEGDAGKQDEVVDDLLAVPLNGAEADAHDQ